MNKKKLIVFIHIEACGGTTFHFLLYKSLRSYFLAAPDHKFYNNGIFSVNQIKKLRTFKPNLEGIGGHRIRSFAGYEQAFPNHELLYITFLRDPIKRYISGFNYLNKVGRSCTLDEYLKMEWTINMQTRRLSRNGNVKEAIENTEKFFFIGLTEMYENSIKMLKNKLAVEGIQLSSTYTHKNISASPNSLKIDQITEKDMKLIQENNMLDLELYNYFKDTCINSIGQLVDDESNISMSNSLSIRFHNFNYKLTNLKNKILILPLLGK